MKRSIVVVVAGVAGVLLGAAPATAAEGSSPTLGESVVDVRPSGNQARTQVHERIRLSGVTKGSELRNILATFDGVRVNGLRITVAGERVEPEVKRGTDVSNVTFPAPAAGELSYSVRYEVVTTGGATKVPLLVPAYATTGDSKVVNLRYHVPEDYYVQGNPYPVNIGTTGTQSRNLVGVPTFLDYELGPTPPGPLSLFNLIGAAVIALIIVVSVLMFYREARALRRRQAHV